MSVDILWSPCRNLLAHRGGPAGDEILFFWSLVCSLSLRNAMRKGFRRHLEKGYELLIAHISLMALVLNVGGAIVKSKLSGPRVDHSWSRALDSPSEKLCDGGAALFCGSGEHV